MDSKFFFKDEFIVPSKDNNERMEAEIEAGNPFAALHKSILLQTGAGCGYGLSTRAAMEVVKPFIGSNIHCKARYGILMQVSAATDAEKNESERIMKEVQVQILKLADEGSYYACMPSGVILNWRGEAALIAARRSNNRKLFQQGYNELVEAEKYLRKAAGHEVKTPEDIKTPGCAYTRYNLSVSLKERGQRMKDLVAAKALLDECLYLELAAAEGKMARAQQTAGRLYFECRFKREPDENGLIEDPLGNKKTPKELDEIIVGYFTAAIEQGLFPAKFDLARFYEATNELELAEILYLELREAEYAESYHAFGMMLEKQERYAEAIMYFRDRAEYLELPSLFKLLNYAYDGKPGVNKNPRIAYQVSSQILKMNNSGVMPDVRKRLIEIRDYTLALSWLPDGKGSFRLAKMSDDIFTKEEWRCAPDDLMEARAFLFDLAGELDAGGRPVAPVSLDLTKAIIQNYLAGEKNEETAAGTFIWSRYAAEKYQWQPAMINLAMQSDDLGESLRYIDKLLAKDYRADPRIDRPMRDKLQGRRDAIYNEKPPRLWVLGEDRKYRPVTRDDKDLKQTISVPGEKNAAIKVYGELAREHKSAQAALIAVALLSDEGREEETFHLASFGALTLDNMALALALAERYHEGRGTEKDDLNAYTLYVQIYGRRNELPSDDFRDRLDALQKNILAEPSFVEQAWALNAEGILCPLQNGIGANLQLKPGQEVGYYPKTEAGFKALAVEISNSLDARTEYALRGAHKIGCDPDSREIFRILTELLLDRADVPPDFRGTLLPAFSQKRLAVLGAWEMMAPSITVRYRTGTGEFELIDQDSPKTPYFCEYGHVGFARAAREFLFLNYRRLGLPEGLKELNR